MTGDYRQRLKRRLPGARDRQAMDRMVSLQKQLQKDLAGLRRQLRGNEDIHVVVEDAQFELLAKLVFGHGQTVLGRDRLWILWQAVRNTATLGGAAAEVGTYRGGSAYFIAGAFVAQLGHEVPVEVIDTFEGHPEDKLSEHDGAVHHKPKTFTQTSYEQVRDYLSAFELVTVHAGEFTVVAPNLPERNYGFVHVDVDLYEAMLDCLRYFGPRLLPGGVIVLDDYGSKHAGGVRKAAEEYLAEADGFQSWHPHTKQLVLVRRG
jgi:hypothetical protein